MKFHNTKGKEKILKASEREKVIYKGTRKIDCQKQHRVLKENGTTLLQLKKKMFLDLKSIPDKMSLNNDGRVDIFICQS